MNSKKERFYLIDALRGFTIINMVLFHFLYNVNIIYGQNLTWYDNSSTIIWQQYICCSFILIAGFVWELGRVHNLRRGIILNLWGGVITLITSLALPQAAIWFGILSFMGCAILLMIPLHPLFKKVPPSFAFVLSIICFFLFRNIQNGYIGWGNTHFLNIPEVLYRIKPLTILGLPHPDFYSSDYFPILPWFFLFCAGYFLKQLFGELERVKHICTSRIPLLSIIGQKSLLIYLLHQPILMLLCAIIYGMP